jgi:hypothetical protein
MGELVGEVTLVKMQVPGPHPKPVQAGPWQIAQEHLDFGSREQGLPQAEPLQSERQAGVRLRAGWR